MGSYRTSRRQGAHTDELADEAAVLAEMRVKGSTSLVGEKDSHMEPLDAVLTAGS